MISYEELDRALARWKARTKGGTVEAPAPYADSQATPMPIRAEELGSIPNEVSPIPGERTGEIDANAAIGSPAEQELITRELRHDMEAAILRRIEYALRAK